MAEWNNAIIKVRRLNCQRKRKILPRLIAKQNNKCHWCGIEMTPPKKQGDGNPKATSATIEHVIPLADGGRNLQSNLVAAHRHCNNTRNTEFQLNQPGGDAGR